MGNKFLVNLKAKYYYKQCWKELRKQLICSRASHKLVKGKVNLKLLPFSFFFNDNNKYRSLVAQW
jgi:hypothetical protein